MIQKAKNNEKLPVYGDGMNIRDWIFVDDHCQGIWDALRFGDSGDIFNFGGNSELTNIDLVKNILLLMKKPESLITFVEDRLGHDFRYAIDHSFSTKKLGWKPKVNFKQGLEKTLNWYIDNNNFMDKLTKK